MLILPNPDPLLNRTIRQAMESQAGGLTVRSVFEMVESLMSTMDAELINRAAFGQWRLIPRALRDIATRDLSTTVLGTPMRVPLMLAPISYQTIYHPEGELASARAAAETGVPYIAATLSSYPMEQIAAVLGQTPRWFQLYVPTHMDLALSFVRRAEQAGYTALVITVDFPRIENRMELPIHMAGHGIGNYITDPVFQRILGFPPALNIPLAGLHVVQMWRDPHLTWEKVRTIKRATRLPVLLKGILNPADAAMAVSQGLDGLIVSTHAGEALDGAPGSIDALPAVVEAVGGRIPVLMDSFVRRGADVLKALALGARAVAIGRPYTLGLLLGGQPGVKAVLDGMIAHIDDEMALAGITAVGQIDRNLVVRAPRQPEGAL